MGIDYIVGQSCQVKDELSLNKMVDLIKGRDQANVIVDMLRKSGDQRPISEMHFVQAVRTPQGMTQQEVSVQSLLDESRALEAYESVCSRCTANVQVQPFGCYGSIFYPIEKQTEEWLMSLLPAELESTAGKLLRSAIKDFGYDGKPIRDMRSQSMFFESNQAVTRKWGGLPSRWVLESDQLLQMMFCVGSLQPTHSSILALFLGAIPHNVEPEHLRARELLSEIWTSVNVESRANTAQVQKCVGFLNALKASSILGVELIVDY